MIGSDLVKQFGDAVDKVFTSDEERDKARNVLAKIEKGIADGQVKLNMQDGQSDDKFRTRWRPAIGWVCVIALGYSYILHPLLHWFCAILGIPSPPDIGMEQLMPLVIAMLGLGGIRSFDKNSQRKNGG